VVWGALVAFVVVMLLTPAVGGMARLLGAVDTPGGRRLNLRPVPRLGGLALFLGIFVPSLAFLPLGRETRGLLLGAAIAVTVGAIDDFQRAALVGEALRAAARRGPFPRGSGSGSTASRSRSWASTPVPAWLGVPLTILWIVAIMNMVNFLDGLDGLAAGVCAISRVHVRGDRAVARPAGCRDPCRDRLRRVPPASCGTTSIRRGSSWATRGRCCSASSSRRSPCRAC